MNHVDDARAQMMEGGDESAFCHARNEYTQHPLQQE